MQARRLLPTLLTAVMVSASCSAATPNAADVPPPLVDDSINTEAAFPDDGLTRLVITPVAGAPAPSASSGGSAASDPGDPTRVLTPEMLAVMPPGASLEARDGQVGYVDADGVFVAFDPALVPTPEASPSTDQPADENIASYDNPHIEALAADPAVKNIIEVGDGTFGVMTSDPSVIDPAVFTSVEDVPFAISQDQHEGYQWHLENDGTNLDRVVSVAQSEDADLDISPTLDRADGKGVIIAVIDSGVDFSHSDLENSTWSNLGEVCGNGVDDDGNGYVDDCNGWDFAYNDAEPYNAGSNTHGTHVAGIITANRDGSGVVGVAPAARIMDLNVAYPNGSMSGAAITAAIRYAVDNGADIINMSLGTNPGADPRAMGGMLAAIDHAGANGVLVVVAAGNSNADIGTSAVFPASFDRPNMIVVAASAPDDSKADFSNYSADIVDLYAPGVLILSTVPGDDYRFMSGTSQASPATAAVAALVMQTSSDAGVDEVIRQVVGTVDPVEALVTSASNGRANAASALGVGDGPATPTELDVSVAGLLGADNEVNAQVAIVTPAEVFDEEYRWELSLINSSSSGAFAIVDQPFEVNGVETATGSTGALVLGPSSTDTVSVSTKLPDGLYSFVIEAVPTADASVRLGDVFVTTFQVGDGAVVVADPDPAPSEPGSPSTTVSRGSNGATTTPPTGGNGSSTSSPTAPVGSETTVQAAGGGSGGGGATSTTSGGSGGQAATTSTTTNNDGQTGGGAASSTPAGETPSTTGPQGTAPTTAAPGVPGDPVSSTPSSGGGSGGQSPALTTPSGSTPPSSAPTESAPVPPEVGDDSATNGDWVISSIRPQAGYVDTANSVTIRGSFPAESFVWFGEQTGEIVFQTDDLITVRTPLRSNDGLIDVSLRTSGGGTVLTVPDAYAFVGWGTDRPIGGSPGSGGGSDGTSGGDSSGGGDAGSGDSNSGGPDGGDSGSGDSGSGDSGSGDSGSGDSDGGGADGDTGSDSSAGDRQPRMVAGSATTTPNGLKGVAISPNPAADTSPCRTDPCSATRR